MIAMQLKSTDAQSDGFRWTMVPAAMLVVMGLLSLAFGVYAVGVMVYVIFVQHYFEHVGEMLAGCFLYLGTGTFLLIAGVQFWKRKVGPAILSTIVAMLIPTVLFAI